MTTETLSFRHRFEPGSNATLPPLLLLHGTGGDENDLLPLGQAVAPGAALLSPRGQVLEHGMPRFFRRLAEGVFDEEDLRRQTDALADFVLAAREAYHLPPPMALGFSNGANIAAAMLLRRPGVLRGAALLRAMVPFQSPPSAKLEGAPVLVLSGAADPIVPAENSARLATLLEEAGASVTHRVLPGGHGLTQMDLGLVKSWLAAL
jgi:phospholipase/carboxylesterase